MRDIEIPNCKNYRQILAEVKSMVGDFVVPETTIDNLAMWVNKKEITEERINSLEGLLIKFIVLRKFLEDINIFPEGYEKGVITTVDDFLKNRCVVLPDKKKGYRIVINDNIDVNVDDAEINIPENLTVYGDFKFFGSGQRKLPSGLNIDGNLDIYSTKIWSLPDDLHVGGEIVLNAVQSDMSIMEQATALKRKGRVRGIRVE